MSEPQQRDVDELREQIEAVILRGADDFFDAPEDRAALEVTVRVCCEFYDFLARASDPPDSSDANYMASTIRSGMDEYFTMEQYGRIWSGLKLQGRFFERVAADFCGVEDGIRGNFSAGVGLRGQR